jgi:hypothetical protein
MKLWALPPRLACHIHGVRRRSNRLAFLTHRRVEIAICDLNAWTSRVVAASRSVVEHIVMQGPAAPPAINAMIRVASQTASFGIRLLHQ